LSAAITNSKASLSKERVAPKTSARSGDSSALSSANIEQAGNQAVQRLLRGGAVQGKLAISHPDDLRERQAEAISNTVLHSHVGFPISNGCSCAGECEECRESGLKPQLEAAPPSRPAAVSGSVAHLLRSSGYPLEGTERAFFEPRFGHDFAEVRIHANAEADRVAAAIHANAFSAGRDIFFASGRYAPSSEQGRKLLAHELTHTIQHEEDSAGDRTLLQRQPFDSVVFQPNDAPAWGDLRSPFATRQGIAGPLQPQVEKTDDALRINQKDAQHVEIANGEAWITITADPGAHYSFYVEPLIAARQPNPD